jgi:hypothetical protein
VSMSSHSFTYFREVCDGKVYLLLRVRDFVGPWAS